MTAYPKKVKCSGCQTRFHPGAEALEDVILDDVSVREPEIYDLEQPVVQQASQTPSIQDQVPLRNGQSPVRKNRKLMVSSTALFLLAVPVTVGVTALAMRLPKKTEVVTAQAPPVVQQVPVARQAVPPVVQQAPRRGKAVVQLRPKVETKVETEVDQRDKLLAELEVKTKEEVEGAKKKKALNDERIKQLDDRERTQRKALRSTRSAKERQHIEGRLAQISKEREWLNTEIRDSHADIILDDVEQKKRQIIKKFPRPGDPKYVEVEVTPDTLGISQDIRFVWVGRTRLLDENEVAAMEQQTAVAAAEKERREMTKDPLQVADAYLGSLIQKGVLKSAQFIGTDRALDTIDGFQRAQSVPKYNYRVEYVSEGGLLNVRECFVLLYRKDGGWAVTPTTVMATLGGLPGGSVQERFQRYLQGRDAQKQIGRAMGLQR
jgi:hypothetical protein